MADRKPKSGRRRTYVGRVYLGNGKYKWCGRYPTRKARDAAVARARVELERARSTNLSCGEWVDRYLARYERDHKASSADTARGALKQFKEEFGDRPLRSITRFEAMERAERVPVGVTAVIVTMFNAAVDAELVDRSPFRGLGRRGRGRSDQAPPTEEEFAELVEACAAHGWYAPQMRALLVFCAYSGLRPGEAFALEWSDVDFDAMRIDVRRRVYRGTVDLPKSNKPRRIALTPPARDALLTLPYEHEGLVFRSKRGVRLSQPTLSGYWGSSPPARASGSTSTSRRSTTRSTTCTRDWGCRRV